VDVPVPVDNTTRVDSVAPVKSVATTQIVPENAVAQPQQLSAQPSCSKADG
jgi:hypothetical protein